MLSDPGMGHYRPRVALALFSSPIRSAMGRWSWGFHTVRSGVDPEINIFVPGLSELYIHEGISEPGMGIYPRARRDRGVPPRGNSRRARRAPSLAKGGRGGRLDRWDWGSENAGMKVICLLYDIYKLPLRRV